MLHELVIDSLTDVHLVGALPLLGVNQHLRQLVIKRLVAAYSKATQVAARSERPLVPVADDGEFVSMWLNCVAPQEGPHKEDDPRYMLAQARKRDRSESDATDFVLDKFDPKTQICTFKPAGEGVLEWPFYCNNAEERAVCPELGHRGFSLVATGAFRRAGKGEPHLKGLTVAVNPKLYPNPWGEFYPQISDELDATISEKDKKLANGWQITYTAGRMDTDPLTEELAGNALGLEDDVGIGDDLFFASRAYCMVDNIKIPLLDLFAPRDLCEEQPWYEW
ncbi:hypothetical protein JCM8115_005186 [Rhodotorula mucilaginosa]|nr:hypothetical protein B0A53_02516 [Rhodotorula sp. CCFEE 5036]